MGTQWQRVGLPSVGYRGRMLVVLSLGWAALQGGRFLLPPLLPSISETFGLSSGAAGLVLTGFGLVYAVTQYPSGTYSDALSRATLLVPAFLALSVAFALIGAGPTVWVFTLGALLLGVGKGLFASPSRALLGDLFAERRGRALGIFAAGTDVGGLLAAGLAAVVLATTGWRVAFAPVVVVLGLVTALFLVWNREAYDVERPTMAPGETIRRVVGTRARREMLLAYSLFYFAVGGLTNFLPTLLVEHNGYSETLASAVFALVFVVGMVIKPTAGEVSDRFPRVLVSVAGLLVAAGGIAVVVFAQTLPGIVAGTVLIAVGYKTQFPIADAIVIETAQAGSVGGDLGAARGVFLLGNALGPGVVGLVAGVASYRVAFGVLAASLVASAGVLLSGALRGGHSASSA